MTGLVQNSSEATGSCSLSPLIVSRDSLSLSSLQDERSAAGPIRMALNIFLYIIFIIFPVCVLILITSPLGVAVVLVSI